MNKRVLSVILQIIMVSGALGLSAVPAAAQPSENPVRAYITSAPAASSVEEKADGLNEYGLFLGTGSGYDLEGGVTRAQAVTMVLRYVGAMTEEYNSAAAVFTDVPKGHWADGHIGKAVKLGIARGVSGNTFEPERAVTEQEFKTFMLRAIGYTDANLFNCNELAYNCGMSDSVVFNIPADDFNRGRMVEICWRTLWAVRADGVTVMENLGIKTQNGVTAQNTASAADTSGEYSLEMSLLRKIEKSADANGKNFMYSPFSIKMAFMMAANGAEGETKTEILNAFKIGDPDKYNETAKALIEETGKSKEFKLNIANSIWFNTDYYHLPDVAFAENYKQTVAKYYNAEAREVNNSNAVNTINNWISDKTNKKIENVISQPDFLAALVNTIYFKADWQNPFDKISTRKADFTDKNNTVKQTDFMRQRDHFGYFENERLQMLSMRYKGSDISMYVFLPKGGVGVTADDMQLALGSMDFREVIVEMPKFKTEFSISLNEIINELGVKKAFDETCMDFREVMLTGVPAADSVYISKVLHKSFIEVDEKGTEAAAATAIIMAAGAMPDIEEPKQFIADHPFIYMIRDDSGGEILFMGQYAYVE